MKTKPKPTKTTPIAEGKRQQIDPKLIDPHPHNRQITAESCKELAESMRSHGQIQPATVRPHPTKKGRFQLGAGARRWTAAKLIGRPLDCIVRPLTDDEIEAMLAVENLQRENPEPREEAAQIRRLFQLPSSTPQSVAAMLGRPDAWVKRRMKLLDLIEPVHEAWQDAESGLHALPVASMELVAALSSEQQMAFLEEFGERNSWDGPASSSDAYRWIQDLGCSLKEATWLDNPATFIPGCGPGCATSSTAADLFSQTEFADNKRLQCAQCLNSACFNKRKDLARAHAWHTAMAKAPEGYYAITNLYGDTQVTLPDGSTLKPRSKHDFHGWKPGKKSDAQAKPFLEETDGTVKLTWKLPPKDAETIPKSAAETSVKSPEESLQASIDRLQGKRYTLLLDELKDHVEKAECPTFSPDPRIRADHLIALAAIFGTEHRLNNVGDRHYREHQRLIDRMTTDNAWDSYHRRSGDAETDLWHAIRAVLSCRLRDRAFTDRKSDLIKPEFITEMIHVAQLTGFDYPAAYQRAVTACKIPASLKNLDPVTLK